MSDTLLQRVLFLVDRIESPVISHADAVAYSRESLAELVSNGILGRTFKATRIPRPLRFGTGDDLLVRETAQGLFGVAEEDDFIEPLPLVEDDRRVYEISLQHLVNRIRIENGIDGAGFEDDKGLVPLGTKTLGRAVPAWVYLSLPNCDEQALLARCMRLCVPQRDQRTYLLVPQGIAFPSESRRVLADINVDVLSLMDRAGTGKLALDWTSLVTSADTSSLGARIIHKVGRIWTLYFDGKPIQLTHQIGLAYLSYLLHAPGQQFHVAQFVAAAKGTIDAAGKLQPLSMGSSGEVLDDAAIANYKRQYASLQKELTEATRDNNSGRREALETEMEQLTHQINSAFGLGGTRRRSADADRLRKRVSIALSRAIRTIRRDHKSLADYLQRSIDRGYLVFYRGDGILWNS